MTITSKTYIAAELTSTGDHVLYTVPTGTISRIQSFDTGSYADAGSIFDISVQVLSPGGITAPWLFAPYLAPREGLHWNGILNLIEGYQLNVFIGATDGTVAMGVLMTGEDFT